MDKEYIKDADKLAQYIGYYLSETVEDLSGWDCEHLAINMLKELEIEKPEWWDKRLV
jgi:hypothetical protein